MGGKERERLGIYCIHEFKFTPAPAHCLKFYTLGSCNIFYAPSIKASSAADKMLEVCKAANRCVCACVLVWLRHKYLFALLLQATWRMRDVVAAAAAAHSTRNAGACVRLTAATRDKHEARPCRGGCCCCSCCSCCCYLLFMRVNSLW